MFILELQRRGRFLLGNAWRLTFSHCLFKIILKFTHMSIRSYRIVLSTISYKRIPHEYYL